MPPPAGERPTLRWLLIALPDEIARARERGLSIRLPAELLSDDPKLAASQRRLLRLLGVEVVERGVR